MNKLERQIEKEDRAFRAWKQREQEKAFLEKFGFPDSEVARWCLGERAFIKKDGTKVTY